MEKSHRESIRDQSVSYRRGLVMGLTMAEVGILIIFVLLMLIGFNQWQSYKKEKEREDSQLVKIERLQSLEEDASSLAQIKQSLDIPQGSTVDEIQPLIRVINEMASNRNGQTALQEARQATKEMREIRDAIEKAGGSKELANRLQQQSQQIATKEGQLKHAEARLAEAGLGTGERPCWVKPDGTIEYLYDIVLESGGIRMKEHRYQEREQERSSLPMPVADPGEVLSPAEFVRRTLPLYEQSQKINCRFFVVIYDATGPTEKITYKNLLRIVEGHFYKYLANGPPQF